MRFEEKFQLGSARLKNWDYSQDGFYFVTICSCSRANIFGEIRNDQMILGDFGKIVERCWRAIPTHFVNVHLDEFVIMPNHLHGIVVIDNPNHLREIINFPRRNAINRVSTTVTRATISKKTVKPKPGGITGDSNPMGKKSLGEIIRWFKGKCSFEIHQTIPALNCVWQNNFYDHIIRDEEELNRIRDYIILNPKRWNEDKENLKNN